MSDLSVIIPARNEEFLQRTIDDILANAEGDTEVIAILDGYWSEPGIKDHPKVTLIHHEVSIGQRAATNEGARISQAKYIMKADAHCMFDKGFDIKLMADCEYDWTVIPRMYVLDAFHWICEQCRKEWTQQGPRPTECDKCKNTTDFEKRIIWKIKRRKRTDYMWFDTDLRIKYFDRPGLKGYGSDINATKKKYSHKIRDWTKGDITDVMCGIGACWFLHRERYFELGGMDEGHGSWGQMAVELACKSWLSGGRHVVNKKTWFAHLPRTQKGFSWPYPNPVEAQEHARAYSKNLWFNNKWEGRKHDIDWLINKFAPLPGWDGWMQGLCTSHSPSISPNLPGRDKLKNETISKGLVYYTDNNLDQKIMRICQKQLQKATNGNKIVSVSLNPIDFGDVNIRLFLKHGYLTMFKQILAGLKLLDTDIVFLVEHDILYASEHFSFIPPKKDVFYYNENTYKLDYETGQALFYYCKQTSGLCAYRELLIEHYQKRVKMVEEIGFSRKMGFEPGTHGRAERVDNYKSEAWMSKVPNVDIRHGTNLTQSRWSESEFRNKKSCRGWKLTDGIPYWGITKGRFDEFLFEI